MPHLILTSTSNILHSPVCFAHLVNSSSFHYNKPGCYVNIDTLEVPEQIEAVLAKALRHLSILSARICCETTVAISLLATTSCAAQRSMAPTFYSSYLPAETWLWLHSVGLTLKPAKLGVFAEWLFSVCCSRNKFNILSSLCQIIHQLPTTRL